MKDRAQTNDTSQPVRSRPWPKWPRATVASQRNILNALHSGNWTISGYTNKAYSFERDFSEQFASFHDAAYAITCASGSAALTIALESVGVGAFDEVVLPGLTWVAGAVAVCHAGAVPVLVDVDPNTLAMSVTETRAALTKRTAAILLVHPYCNCVAIDEFLLLSKEYGIPLIEDCSQAHGAAWDGKKVGSFGDVGVFSTQQSKLLTSGEGGICITNSHELCLKLQELRCNGRRYREHTDGQWAIRLEESGAILGRNYCLSEFQSAILLEGLTRLEIENEHRRARVTTLDKLLREIPGIAIIQGAEKITARVFWRLCLRIDRESFKLPPDLTGICQLLSRELNIEVKTLDRPTNENPLYAPWRHPKFSKNPSSLEELRVDRFQLPNAWKAYSETVCFPHWCLLGDDSDMEDIVSGLRKVLLPLRSSSTRT